MSLRDNAIKRPPYCLHRPLATLTQKSSSFKKCLLILVQYKRTFLLPVDDL